MFKLLNYTCEIIKSTAPDLIVSNPGITRIDVVSNYTEEITDRRLECNILDMVRDKVQMSIEMGCAPFSSWVLARFWQLTNGSIIQGLNVDTNGNGGQDGGWYVCRFEVKDQQQVLAYLYLEACSWYEQFFLTSYQENINPVEIEEGICAVLLKDIYGLAQCRITISDFETDEEPFQYGWDKNKFLGKKN